MAPSGSGGATLTSPSQKAGLDVAKLAEASPARSNFFLFPFTFFFTFFAPRSIQPQVADSGGSVKRQNAPPLYLP